MKSKKDEVWKNSIILRKIHVKRDLDRFLLMNDKCGSHVCRHPALQRREHGDMI